MGKQGEVDYFSALTPHEQRHAVGKPFSDIHCGVLLTRMGQVMTLLPPAPARVLDLGCGTGWTSVFLAQRGYDVVGVDIAPDMVRAAQQNAPLPTAQKLEFRVADYESLDATDDFDGVVFFDSLHHAEDEQAALQCAYRALKTGGVCVVSEPGKGHHEAAASVHAVDEYGVTEKEMPPSKVISLARKIGFKSWRVKPNHGQLLTLLNGSQLSQRGGLLGWLLQIPILKPVVSIGLIAGGRYLSGVVTLVK